MAYLDHNATSPMRNEARAAIARALTIGGNPSSIHREGRAARALIENAREEVASLAGAQAKSVTFTSGGSEANVTALSGALHGGAEEGARISRLFVSAIEHESVMANAVKLEGRFAGLRVTAVPATQGGQVDLTELARSLREGTGRALVAVMLANNETGVIQPIADVVALAKECGALLLVDAIQAAGKIPLDFTSMGADYLTLSAHKIGGPQGAGALVMNDNAPSVPLIAGGGQESGRRAGTENLAGIAAFGAAAKAAQNLEESGRVGRLRDSFELALRSRFPDAVIFGAESPRLPNTSNFALPGIPAETALIALDLDGVMVSSGAACSSGRVEPSHVLQAMGVADALARCALRVSLGWNSTETDIEEAIASIERLSARIARRAA